MLRPQSPSLPKNWQNGAPKCSPQHFNTCQSTKMLSDYSSWPRQSSNFFWGVKYSFFNVHTVQAGTQHAGQGEDVPECGGQLNLDRGVYVFPNSSCKVPWRNCPKPNEGVLTLTILKKTTSDHHHVHLFIIFIFIYWLKKLLIIQKQQQFLSRMTQAIDSETFQINNLSHFTIFYQIIHHF